MSRLNVLEVFANKRLVQPLGLGRVRTESSMIRDDFLDRSVAIVRLDLKGVCDDAELSPGEINVVAVQGKFVPVTVFVSGVSMVLVGRDSLLAFCFLCVVVSFCLLFLVFVV